MALPTLGRRHYAKLIGRLRVLCKSTRTLRRMLHDGKLAGRKAGGTWRIPESELERLTHVPLYAGDGETRSKSEP